MLASVGRTLRRILGFPIVIACLIAVIGAIATYAATAKPYEERASLFTADPQAANPFINVGRGQYAASEVVARRILADQAIIAKQRSGALARFSLQVEQNLNEPLLNITVHGASKNLVVATLRTVISDAQQQLAAVQRELGSPPNQFFEYTVISETPVPEVVRHDAIQRAIEVLLALFLVSYLTGLALVSYRKYRADEARSSAGRPRRLGEPRDDAADQPSTVTSKATRWLSFRLRREGPRRAAPPTAPG